VNDHVDEIALTGGISTPGIVRVGDTVRRPIKDDSDYVHALLVHLEQRGFAGAPRYLGIDSRGRAVLSFIDGFAPPHNGYQLTEAGVAAAELTYMERNAALFETYLA
jgi:hypothetical protein